MSKELNLSHFLSDTIYIILGIVFSAFAMKSFLVPNHFLDGGVTGLSLLGHEVFHWNLGLLLILTNLPFIVMGAYQVSKGFAVKTSLAVIGLAIALQYIEFPTVTSDNLLVSMFGGFFLGLGIGLAMRGGCAIDGLEVLALYTLKKTSFTITEVILGMNIVIFLAAGIHFGIETALYAMLTYYIAMRTIDYVIEGMEAYTGVTIISGKSDEVKEALVLKMGRGITIYKGERGFMKDSFDVSHDCDIVFTVITRLEVRKLKNVVHRIDPKAFVFTHTIKETAGGVLKRKVVH
ncbi:MAG TPA: YitT family protein [Flavipsychrobacter sp.]|nr:YitT family protein [Flavipsychrobacter sp.]